MSGTTKGDIEYLEAQKLTGSTLDSPVIEMSDTGTKNNKNNIASASIEDSSKFAEDVSSATSGSGIQANLTTTSSQANIDAHAKKRAMLVDPEPVSSERLGFNHRHKIQMNKPLRGVLKNTNKKINSNPSDHHEIIQSSPLLTSTPPSISRALIRLYPYLIVFDKILSLLTWSGEDIWGSVLLLCIYITINLYFQTIVTYFGHLTCVLLLWLYSNLDKFVGEEMEEHPTLDDIIHTVSSVSFKFDLLLSPITVLSTNDIRRLLITTVFLSPIYMIITMFFLPKGNLMLLLGVIGLSYHSSWSRVARKMLWKSKAIRLLCFYITGLDIDGIKGYKNMKNKSSTTSGLFSSVQKKLLKGSKENENKQDNKPIRFTYVLYENQRRWLGIGWTANMLSYERCPWTDEFLNEAPDPENFKLPDDSSSGMVWRWVDKTWRLDMSNDGAIQVSSSRPKTTAAPNSDDGYIYYDNTWKKPSTDDTYSKYTRRRRWVRTAELIKVSETFRPAQPASSEAIVETQGVQVQVASATSTGVDLSSGNRLSVHGLNPVDSDEILDKSNRKVSFSDKENVIVFDNQGKITKNNTTDDNAKLTPKLDLEESSKSNNADLHGQESEKQHSGTDTTNNIKYSFSSSNNNDKHTMHYSLESSPKRNSEE